jgi:hypothetical protein
MGGSGRDSWYWSRLLAGVTATAVAVGLSLAIVPSAGAATTTLQVSGVVRDDQGTPVAGAVVNPYFCEAPIPNKPPNCHPLGPNNGPKATSDGNGLYSLTVSGLSTTVGASAFLTATPPADPGGYLFPQTITLPAPNYPSSLDFVLGTGARVAGIVTDHADQPVPFPDVIVTANDGAGYGLASANDGSYSILVPSYTYPNTQKFAVFAYPADFPTEGSVLVDAPDAVGGLALIPGTTTSGVNLQFHQPGTITGVVTDAGVPLTSSTTPYVFFDGPFASCAATSPECAQGVSSRIASIDATGHYVLTGVPPSSNLSLYLNENDVAFQMPLAAIAEGASVVCNIDVADPTPACSSASGPVDADHDGIIDSIDPDGGTGASVGAFADSRTPPTFGTITDPNGLTVQVTDATDPADGVSITTGSGTGPATLSVCGFGTLAVAANSTVVLTCGSIKAQVVTGSASIAVGGVVVNVPAGATGKVSDAGGGNFTVESLTGSGITVTNNGVTTTVPTGGTTIIDTTPPTITPVVTGTLGTNGWYTTTANLAWTVTDPDSTVSSKTGCGPVVVTADTTGTGFTCTATSSGGSASKSVTIKRDATLPALTFGSHPASYTIDQNIAITCVAADATSGLATPPCVNVNAPAYTFALGANTLTRTATDQAGNNRTASTGFTIVATIPTLCKLTNQFTQASAKYLALTAKQRQVVDALDAVACQILNGITPKLNAKQKAALVASYKTAVNALVTPGWLTTSQATTLVNAANTI